MGGQAMEDAHVARPREEPATSCRLRYQLSRNWAHPEGPRPTLHGLHSEEDPGQATADGRPTDKDSQGGRSAGEEHERVGQGSTSPSSVLAQLGLAVAAGVMAGGKGCYAMEAAGGSAGWDPERAIEVASLERAREVLGQDAGNDLAFAFESYADAMAAGGHPLASQWAVARGQAEAAASLSQAGADDSGLGSPRDLFPKPLLRPRPLRHQEISLAANRYEPAAALQRVEALLQCLVEMAVQRPPRDCTEELMVEWRKQLRRLAQQHVTQMDSQTIINAIRTWKELAHFQEDRGLLSWVNHGIFPSLCLRALTAQCELSSRCSG